jgi:hypothetical protein
MPLYIDKIFRDGGQGTITINYPNADGNGNTSLKGYTAQDISFTLKNNWAPLIPDLTALSDVSQLLEMNIVNFVSASKVGWKGTDPISFPVEFYLFSYSPEFNIKQDILGLMKLATLYTSNEQTLTAASTVQVHGGFSQQFWQANNDLIDSSSDKPNSYKDANSVYLGSEKGTISINVGNTFTLRNLLLGSITVTHSNVQVSKGIPLFIKVDAEFQGTRAAIASDLDGIY